MATARQTRPAAPPRKPAPAARATKAGTPNTAATGRASARRKSANPRLGYDIAGIGLVALALILFATLLYPPSRSGENVVGAAVTAGLRLVVGAGAWAFPLVLLVSGALLAVGRSRSWDNIGGAVLLFLLGIAWWHLGHVPPAGQWATDNLLAYGGYVGAGLSWGVRSAVGTAGGHVLFASLVTVAILYLTDIPLPSLLAPLDRLAVSGARVGREAVASGSRRVRDRASELSERRNAIRARPVAADEFEDEEDAPAATRPRVRLFQRAPALVPPAETPVEANTAPAPPAPEPTPPPKRRSLFPRTTPEPGETVELVEVTEDAGAGEVVGMPVAAIPGMTKEGKALASASVPRGVNAAAPALEDAKKFALPPTNLLRPAVPVVAPKSGGEGEGRREVLLQTLEDFGIGADVSQVAHGPTITRYEVTLERGIKVSKIVSLADNLAMALAAIDVRVEAPIPGKSAIGIEVPNEHPTVVTLREVIERPEFGAAPGKLTFALGKDVTGVCRYADLAKMPHLLIAGSTGSGKSAGLNSLICSLLYRCTPRELKLLMIDPKKVELSLYDGIPHLAAPVITDVKQAPSIFKQAIREMETRYDKFAKVGTRNIEGYNGKVEEDERIPYWVLIVDELADLMMTSGPEIETGICRLAQLARATGIHLVIATQRPSVNVITGTIKANISSRIAFAMNSAVDSRTILDSVGADRLIGRGDMLFLPMDAAKPTRIQGCFVSEQETEALVNYLKQQAQPSYDVLPSSLSAATGEDDSGEGQADDELFEAAVKLVVSGGSASTSMLQRRFKIGYTRAARLVDLMEQKGIVGPLDGAKPRDILVSRDQVEAMFASGGGGAE